MTYEHTIMSEVMETPLIQGSAEDIMPPDSATLDSNLPALDKQPFRFLDLPKELRLMVYDLLVVVGKVFYAPDWYELEQSKRFTRWIDYSVPSFEVMCINQQIKEEAEEVYFSKNLFVLPYSFKRAPPISNWCRAISHRQVFSATGLYSIKNLSIAFCNRGSAPLIMTASDWSGDEDRMDISYDEMTPAERQEHAHRRANNFIRYHWRRNVSALKKIKGTLHYLELDLNNAYCPFGCCRDFGDIDFGFLSQLKPKTISVLGLRNGEDKKLLDVMANSMSDKSDEEYFENECKVICNPQEDPWAKHLPPLDPLQSKANKKCNWG